MSKLLVKIIVNKQIIKEIDLSEQSFNTTATPNATYVLVDQDTGKAPKNIKFKRTENKLTIGGDDYEELHIEGFYESQSKVVGESDDEIYYYTTAEEVQANGVPALIDGQQITYELSLQPVLKTWWSSSDNAVLGLGLLGLGATGIAFAGGKDDKPNSSQNNTPKDIPQNQAPTDITLSNLNVDENVLGAVIGTLSTTDPDSNDTHTYTVNDTRFEVVNGQLKLKQDISLDYETNSNINIEVTSTDAKGLSVKKTFSLSVNDVVETGVETLKDTLNNKDNTFIAHDGDQRNFILNALDGDDNIVTANQSDIVRGGTGRDSVNTMAANDAIVVVGKTMGINYKQSDITNAGGSGYNLSNVLTLDEMKTKTTSDITAGEILDGGADNNTLITYGEVDLTQATLKNITYIRAESSDIYISAQQLNDLKPKVVSADGESGLYINSSDGQPITVDFSAGTNLHLFKNIHIGENVTLKVNAIDLYEVQNIIGKGKLQIIDKKIDLSNVNLSVTVLDKNGDTLEAAVHKGNVINGEFKIGSRSDDTIQGSNADDRLYGGAGNDVIIGGAGNDVIIGGAGIDTLDGGDGDDTFIILGDVSVGGKKDTPELTKLLGMPISSLNGQVFNDDEDGAKETIRVGSGTDKLVVIGTADISKYITSDIEKIEIHSDVTIKASEITKVSAELSGDANSTLRIKNDDKPIEVTLKDLNIQGMGHIEVGKNVTLYVSDMEEFGGATIISGEGKVVFTGDEDFTLSGDYTLTDKLVFENSKATDIRGDAEILKGKIATERGEITGTNDDDFLDGSQFEDVLDGLDGNDVLSGKDGNDTFSIHGTGKKTIIDSNNDEDKSIDTLDFGKAKAGVNMDLSSFAGNIGKDTTIQLGAQDAKGVAKGKSSKTNLMLIVDDSGSMSGDRIAEVKKTVDKLLENYQNLGSVAVRIVTFGGSAYYDTSESSGWKTPDEARDIINNLWGNSGSTNYNAAMDSAQKAFLSGKGDQFFTDGNNISFFLSDGEPNSSVHYRENDWENFIIENKITSYAIGFGGLDSTHHLEPISFDGKKVTDINADHEAGEIKALLAEDLNKLSDTVNSLAKTDFIENIVGSDHDDTLTGNKLDNTIHGGKGNDNIMGFGGNNHLHGGEGEDTVIYAGNEADYEIKWDVNIATIKDQWGNTDTIYRDVEKIKFADKTIDTTFLKHEGVKDPFPNVLMSKFASAAYLGETNTRDMQALKEEGWTFLNHTHLNPKDSDLIKAFANNSDIMYYEVGGKKFENGQWIDFHSQGRQDAIHGSAGAIVAQKGDTLVLSFRGTEDVTLTNVDKANIDIPVLGGLINGGVDGLNSSTPIIRGLMNVALKNKYPNTNVTNASDSQFLAAAEEVMEFMSNLVAVREVLTAADAFMVISNSHPLIKASLQVVGLAGEESLKYKVLIELAKRSYEDFPDTDSAGWVDQSSHYAKFEPLTKAIKAYIEKTNADLNEENHIKKVLVTGHSLGAGMASWYLADDSNGAGALPQDVTVQGMPFATPGIAKVNTDLNKTDIDSRVENIIRVETARDLVPDTTDIFKEAIDRLPKSNSLHKLKIGQLGHQYNVVIDTETIYHPKQGVGTELNGYHAMDNYKNYVQYFEDVGLNEDFDFIKSLKNESVLSYNANDTVRPLLSTFLNYWEIFERDDEGNILFDDNGNPKLLSFEAAYSKNYLTKFADTTGDYGAMIRENLIAEHYSENDIIIGTNNNDILIGDGYGSVLGSNDVFYVGKGSDKVYGDTKGDDDGGLDTVVYKFSETLIASTENLKTDFHGSVSDVFRHDRNDPIQHDKNLLQINIDDSIDDLWDIEQFHFVDKASDSINLLAGGANNDRIEGLNGNDYLFGGEGHDFFIEGLNSGNDRIHGGEGSDQVSYNVNINKVSIQNFGLLVELDDGSKDILYSIENISVNTQDTTSLLSTQKLLNFTDQTLLDTYKPNFHYINNDGIGGVDNLQVFGKVVRDNNHKIIGLDYELREQDVASDDSWFVHVKLGEDLLPTYFYTETGGWISDNTVQIRNAFDTSLTHDGNHVNVYLDAGAEGAFFEHETIQQNVDASLKAESYSVNMLGIKTNAWDFDDHRMGSSDNYEQSATPKLAGLVSGQMEMGFLFQENSELAKLGHFDLIGSSSTTII